MKSPNNQEIIILLISFIGIVVPLKAAQVLETAVAGGSKEPNKIEYKSEDLRNPFEEEKIEANEQPQEQGEAKPLPALQITGIVWGGNFPLAIINDKVARVGDTIDEVRITDITKNGVTVFFNNRQYNLTISSPTTSKGSKNSAPGPGKNL